MRFWRAIDWQRPWLAPYRERGQRVCRRLDQGASVAQALNAQAVDPRPSLAAGALRFVAQQDLPDGEAYEAFIARRACVPTRDNLHDLFNGLVWLAFPAWKRRLNELQAEQIARTGIGQTRGAVRDALTLFDENAALWQAPNSLVEVLRARDWTGLFITRRAAWQDARLTLFGHALLEKLTQPRKAITAHLWTLSGPDELSAHRLASKAHLPLPVLGVPGWWRDNESPGFYADAEVFRPRR